MNGDYAFVGALTNASGQIAAHSDMSAFTDADKAYVVTESGHLYELAVDCHSWVSDKVFSAVNGDSGGSESPTVFKAGYTYYWIGSYKTGWRANNNFYSTAPAVTGPWSYRGFIAPVSDPKNDLADERTWLSQSTWVVPVQGCKGTVYLYWGDHWDGNQDTSAPGKHNALATYVFQPLVFSGSAIVASGKRCESGQREPAVHELGQGTEHRRAGRHGVFSRGALSLYGRDVQLRWQHVGDGQRSRAEQERNRGPTDPLLGVPR